MSARRIETLNEFLREGLVNHTSHGYELSLLGEVFMGHLVRDLKNEEGRRTIDQYIAEGRTLGRALSDGKMRDDARANNRQIALSIFTRGES